MPELIHACIAVKCFRAEREPVPGRVILENAGFPFSRGDAYLEWETRVKFIVPGSVTSTSEVPRKTARAAHAGPSFQ